MIYTSKSTSIGADFEKVYIYTGNDNLRFIRKTLVKLCISLSDLRSTWISSKMYDFGEKKKVIFPNYDISNVIEYFHFKPVLAFQWALGGMFRA